MDDDQDMVKGHENMYTFSLYDMYGVWKCREDDVMEELKEKCYGGPLAILSKEENV